MAAYRQSKIAVGLFGLELGRRSREAGWGITSTVAHPGVAPTSLLAARPEMGRAADTREIQAVRWLLARGLIVGTVESAQLPAIMAVTDPKVQNCRFYGPGWPGNAGGPPGVRKPFAPLRRTARAARLWTVSQELTGVGFE